MNPQGQSHELLGELLEGRFRLDEALGAGGMAEVYLGEDVKLKRPVAVKVPHAQLLLDPSFTERFSREVESLIRLDHPRIVKVLDVGEHHGAPFAVMQYLAGGSLAQRLGRGGCTLAEVAAWLPAIAEGLDFLHSRELIHRDVKPENILFDEAGNAYIADFGIAKILGSFDTGLTLTGTTPGTPFYMGPEISTGAPITGRYDQYALATMVYEALAGKRPFTADTPMRLLYIKASDPATPIDKITSNVPTRASAAIMQALEKEPANRFESCCAFATEVLGAATAAAAMTSIPTQPTVRPQESLTDAPTQPHVRAAPPPPPRERQRTPPPVAPPAPREKVVVPAPPPPPPVPQASRSSLWFAIPILLVLVGGIGYVVWSYAFDTGEQRSAKQPEQPPRNPLTLAPPALARCEPASGTVVDSPVTIEGTADIPLLAVTVGGVSAEVVDGKRFTLEVEVPTDGLRTEIVLTGANGTRSDPIPYELAPRPVVELDVSGWQPPRGSTVGREFTLTGVVSAPFERVLVAGAEAEVDVTDGTFSANVVLQRDGATAIDVEIVDAAGGSNSFSHEVEVDLTPPRLVSTDPATGSVVDAEVTLSVTADEPLRSATVGGESVEVDGASFELDVAVTANGLDTEIVLVDRFGNESTHPLQLVRAEGEGWAVTGVPLALGVAGTFGGRSAEPLREVFVDGKPARIVDDGRGFEIDLTGEREGPQDVRIVMTSRDGAQSILRRTIEFDLTGPVLETVTPAATDRVDAAFRLSGTSSEPLQAALIDGQPAIVDGTAFHLDLEITTESHSYEITLVDEHGNRRETRHTVHGDVADPEFVTIDPPSGHTASAARVDVIVETDKLLAEASLDGTEVALASDRRLILSLEPKPGRNRYRLEVRDRFGRQSVLDYLVIRPGGTVTFTSELDLTVMQRLEHNGRLATYRRISDRRRSVRIPAEKVWLVQPPPRKFEDDKDFKQLIDFVRAKSVPGLDLISRKRPKDLGEHLVNLPELTALRIDNCRMSDDDVLAIAKLTALEHLILGEVPVRGKWLAPLASLVNLETLSLEEIGRVRVEDLAFLRRLSRLRELRISGCGITKAEIDRLGLDVALIVVTP